MPTPFPSDALSVFTAWLRTGTVPDPWALLSAVGSIVQWVAGEVGGDGEGLKSALPRDDFEMSSEELANALEARASIAAGLKGGFPWKTLLSFAIQALQAAIAQL